MKSVGEVMAMGRTFKEALMKAWRALEPARRPARKSWSRAASRKTGHAQPERLSYIRYAFERA